MSVAALLRREGGPHVADRPLVPRGHARIAQPPPEPPRRTVRKVAVAAGALFAATAVLGRSVVEDAADRSAAARGAGIPLPPASLPLSADYGWSGNAIGTGATAADEDVVLAAMRQIFAEGVPSEVGSPAFDRLGTEPAAGNQYVAVRRLQTPDRASAGPTGPAVTPESGTVPPGGAGTPPGGTWSYATEPNSSKPMAGRPATYRLAHAPTAPATGRRPTRPATDHPTTHPPPHVPTAPATGRPPTRPATGHPRRHQRVRAPQAAPATARPATPPASVPIDRTGRSRRRPGPRAPQDRAARTRRRGGRERLGWEERPQPGRDRRQGRRQRREGPAEPRAERRRRLRRRGPGQREEERQQRSRRQRRWQRQQGRRQQGQQRQGRLRQGR